mmetsp:Transcript_28804/g.75580  ORF Transcript_28804/g.75580 Transcript_28804/m.75580 type:complete len:204 (+) Transcript_28804:376-987(+)
MRILAIKVNRPSTCWGEMERRLAGRDFKGTQSTFGMSGPTASPAGLLLSSTTHSPSLSSANPAAMSTLPPPPASAASTGGAPPRRRTPPAAPAAMRCSPAATATSITALASRQSPKSAKVTSSSTPTTGITSGIRSIGDTTYSKSTAMKKSFWTPQRSSVSRTRSPIVARRRPSYSTVGISTRCSHADRGTPEKRTLYRCTAR